MEQERKQRKPNRIKEHDYSSPGAYFLTICTSERRNYFWANMVGATIGRPQDIETQNIELSPYGKNVDDAIKNIPKFYPAVTVDYYVIMPDHIHLLLVIRADDNGRPMVAPTASRVVQQLKGYVTKHIGFSIWQKLFYDHVIRNQQDYDKHIKYIHENPMRWQYDKLFNE